MVWTVLVEGNMENICRNIVLKLDQQFKKYSLKRFLLKALVAILFSVLEAILEEGSLVSICVKLEFYFWE